jgi:CheY-like chemotaxis protein
MPSTTTVLVVDDEPVVRLVVTDVLEELGYTVLDAADAETGLAMLQANPRIGLLISDIGLPGGMDGRQLVETARLVRPELKVLFATGDEQGLTADSSELDGTTRLILKPFRLDILASEVATLVNHAGRSQSAPRAA